MAGTTTNNGWTYPTSTDLVTNGASAIQTLATGIDTSAGQSFKAWTPWTVSMSGWTGSGTWAAYYTQIGKTVHAWGRFVPSSTSGIGAPTITLPVAASYGYGQSGGAFMICGGSGYTGGCRLTGTTQMTVWVNDASVAYTKNVAFTSAIPGVWSAAGSDYFTFAITYQAA